MKSLVTYIQGDAAAFRKTDGGLLAFAIDGKEHEPVFVHAAFPHTMPRSYLSIVTKEGNELGVIASLDDVDRATAALLEEQLLLRYHTPVITKVVQVKEEFGYAYWEAETTAGLCRFTTRGNGISAKLVTEQRLLIQDVNGNRFVIPDIGELTDKEYRLVEMCM